MTTAQIQRGIRAEVHITQPAEETAADIEQETAEATHAAEVAGERAEHAAEETQTDIRHNEIRHEFERLHEKMDQHHAERMAAAGIVSAQVAEVAAEVEDTGERMAEAPSEVVEVPSAAIEEVEQATPPPSEAQTQERKKPKYRPGRH